MVLLAFSPPPRRSHTQGCWIFKALNNIAPYSIMCLPFLPNPLYRMKHSASAQ